MSKKKKSNLSKFECLSIVSKSIENEFMKMLFKSKSFTTWNNGCIRLGSMLQMPYDYIEMVKRDYGSRRNLNYEIFWNLVKTFKVHRVIWHDDKTRVILSKDGKEMKLPVKITEGFLV